MKLPPDFRNFRFRAVIWLAAALGITVALCAKAGAAGSSSVAPRCDGVSDDSRAFQSALDAADPTRGGNGIVVVPATGRACLIGTPLNLHSGETLAAASGSATPSSSILAPMVPAASHNPLLISIKEVGHVTLRGLVMDGRMNEVGSSASLVTVYGADHVLLDHILVHESRGTAVTFSGGSRGVTNSGIESSSFQNIGTYYLTSGDKHQDRKQSVVWCCGAKSASGVYVNQHNFVRSSVFGENGFDNLSVAQQSWFVISKNHFAGSRNGANVYCSHNTHLLIAGNMTMNAAGNGIDCFVNDDLSIIDNASSGNGAAGIQAAETHCGLIAHNTTMNNFRSSVANWTQRHPGTGPSVHQGGITIGGEASNTIGTDDVTISGNVSGNDRGTPTQRYGIEVRQTATVHGLSITPDNRFENNVGGTFGQLLTTSRMQPAAGCHVWDGRS